MGSTPDSLDNWHTSNVPRKLTPWFPPAANKDVFFELLRRISDGRYLGKQTDWGAWVAKVSKSEIDLFLSEMYGDCDTYRRETLPHLVEKLQVMIDAVAALEPTKIYALVATEL